MTKKVGRLLKYFVYKNLSGALNQSLNSSTTSLPASFKLKSLLKVKTPRPKTVPDVIEFDEVSPKKAKNEPKTAPKPLPENPKIFNVLPTALLSPPDIVEDVNMQDEESTDEEEDDDGGIRSSDDEDEDENKPADGSGDTKKKEKKVKEKKPYEKFDFKTAMERTGSCTFYENLNNFNF